MKKTKQIAIILIIAITCLIFTNIISIAATATVITETLRLRKEPTTDSKIVDLISEDEKVEILESNVGDDKNWYKVKYNGNTGYVYGEFIKVNNTTSNNTISNNENTNTVNTNTTVPENNTNNTVGNNTSTEKENNEPEENTETTIPTSAQTIEINTYKTVNEQTELYIVPLINSSKIHVLEPNQELYIIQILNGWAYVNNGNAFGWIRCSELK